MKLLLDTHVVVWWFAKVELLSARARIAIAEPSNAILVSAVAAFEITHKHRLGRFADAEGLAQSIDQTMADARFEWLAVSHYHAILAGRLEIAHGDPFDRLLIAQAMRENLTLVTADRVIRNSVIPTLW